MNILLLDDDSLILNDLSKKISEKYGDTHFLRAFCSADEMLRFLEQNGDFIPDLLIADIVLPQSCDGIDIAAYLESLMKGLYTVFITGHAEEYFEDVFFKVKPFGFLSKPINDEKLLMLIDLVAQKLEKSEKELTVNKDGVCFPLRESKIMFMEIQNRRLLVLTSDDTYMCTLSIDEAERFLKNDFIRCHKSFLVNAAQIAQVNDDSFVLYNNMTVPVSRRFGKDARKKFFLWRSAR